MSASRSGYINIKCPLNFIALPASFLASKLKPAFAVPLIARKGINEKGRNIFFGDWSCESSICLKGAVFSVSRFFLQCGRADQHIPNLCFVRDP